VNSLKYVRGLASDEWYVMKNCCVIVPPVITPISVTIKHNATKVNITGELNVIFKVFLLPAIIILPCVYYNIFKLYHKSFVLKTQI
jgi:hypothetical protein